MSTKIQEILTCAAKEIGTKESPANSNKVKYNTWYYGRAVSGSSYPWCAVWVQWIFAQCGCSSLLNNGSRTASCSTLATYAKKHSLWITGNYQPGDLVFMNFSGTKATQHIGIVESVKDGVLYTIEGNTSSDDNGSQSNGGMVTRKKRALKYIVGGYRPQYATEAILKSVTATCYIVKDGDTGTHVKALQALLNANGWAKLTVDGECGSKTVAAIKQFQSNNKLQVDGVAGKNTWNALLK